MSEGLIQNNINTDCEHNRQNRRETRHLSVHMWTGLRENIMPPQINYVVHLNAYIWKFDNKFPTYCSLWFLYVYWFISDQNKLVLSNAKKAKLANTIKSRQYYWQSLLKITKIRKEQTKWILNRHCSARQVRCTIVP